MNNLRFACTSILLCLFAFTLTAQPASFDQLVDQGFSPVSRAVYRTVFFAPRLKDDIIYGEAGVSRSEDTFYEHPPIQLVYSSVDNRIPYGDRITISYAPADSFILSGTLFGKKGKIKLPFAREVSVEGFRFTLYYKPESGYPLEPGRAYYFQVEKVTLLPLVMMVLLFGAIYFSIYFGFVNLTKLSLGAKILLGRYDAPSRMGAISHLRALAVALCSTTGVGNIAGVALALSVGGGGAVFWMLVCALLAMASRFAGATMGVKYRQLKADGHILSGPMYYLREGLKKRGQEKLGQVLAAVFALLCIFAALGYGNMFQINLACRQLARMEGEAGQFLDANSWIAGLVAAALLLVALGGGIRRLARLVSVLLPIALGLYLLGTLWIIIVQYQQLPAVLAEILTGAFTPVAVAGGFMGALFQGISQSFVSSHAGLGTSAMAHATANTQNPASQGIAAMIQPFVDTFVLGLLTALALLLSQQQLNMPAANGLDMLALTFEQHLPLARYVFTGTVVLFALAAMFSWSYYGLQAWTYLAGRQSWTQYGYMGILALFILAGASLSVQSVTEFAFALMFAMAFANIPGLLILAPEVREELSKYIRKIQRGELR